MQAKEQEADLAELHMKKDSRVLSAGRAYYGWDTLSAERRNGWNGYREAISNRTFPICTVVYLRKRESWSVSCRKKRPDRCCMSWHGICSAAGINGCGQRHAGGESDADAGNYDTASHAVSVWP